MVWAKMKKEEDNTEHHMLHEVILEEGLCRPMHYKDVVFDCILKWGSWPEEYRKHNYLIHKKASSRFLESVKLAVPPFHAKGEVYFSGNMIKRLSFSRPDAKKRNFEIQDGMLTCKRKVNRNRMSFRRSNTAQNLQAMNRLSLSMLSLRNDSNNLGTPVCRRDSTLSTSSNASPDHIANWTVNKLWWYCGSDSKRLLPYKEFTLTIISRDNDDMIFSKAHPYFGEAFSFECERKYIEFIAGLLVAEHQDDVKQPRKTKEQQLLKTTSTVSRSDKCQSL